MSLILDALRKSEHQRQRETGPAMAVVPQAGADRKRAAWPLLLAGLLALNIVFVAWLLLRGEDPPAPAPVETVEPGLRQAPALPQRSAAPRAAETTTGDPAAVRRTEALPLAEKAPRPEVRPLAAEVGTASRPSTAAAAGDSATPGDDPQTPTVANRGSRAGAPAAGTENADARLPRFADLVVRGELNVPHMHLDIHVYSGEPAERFVFINMRRYNEGQATQEGPAVQRITRDGVVMSHQGRRFFLSRD